MCLSYRENKSGLFERVPCERKQQEHFRSTPRGLVVQVGPAARSWKVRGSLSFLSSSSIGACGMPDSVMYTANWLGFFDLSGCLARSKKSNRAYHPPIDDEDDDEDDRLPCAF